MEWISENTEFLIGAYGAVVAIASGISATVKDRPAGGTMGFIMKIINIVALNVGKATNDPHKQD